MSILESVEGKDLVLFCECGCDTGIHIKVDVDDNDLYSVLTYTNGAFYDSQRGVIGTIVNKLKKIWDIIWNKDYYYSEVLLSKEDFQKVKEWIGQF